MSVCYSGGCTCRSCGLYPCPLSKSAMSQISQKWTALICQNICLINHNQHTFWYIDIDKPDVTASYGRLFDFIALFGNFAHIIDEDSRLNCCIFTKLSQIICLTNAHILVCQHAKCDCRLWKVYTYLKRYTVSSKISNKKLFK